MSFTPQDLELIELVEEDLIHIGAETEPTCTDHQLRRVSVQLRSLLVEDNLIKCWRLLGLVPKQPVIIAPRLRTEGLDARATAVAGGGQVGGAMIANVRLVEGWAPSPDEITAMYEKEKGDWEAPWNLSDYKESCGVFVNGMKIKRRQIVSYVANKKGGAHLDSSRKKDEDTYKALDESLKGLTFGGEMNALGEKVTEGKNIVYMELLSIGQQLYASADIQRLISACREVRSQFGK